MLRPLALALALAGPLAAQVGGADSTVTVDALRVPDPPGYVLLGGAPSAVERPATVQAFAASVVTRATSGDPFDAFGVQVAPFWMGGIPRLSYAAYERGAVGPEAIRRTLAVSAATDRLDLGDAAPTPAVALGVRMALATGAIDPDYRGYRGKREAAFEALADANSGFREAVEAAVAADSASQRLRRAERAAAFAGDIPLAETFQAQRLVRQQELQDRIEIEADAALAAFDDLATRRVGLVIDVAGGWSAAFPGADFDAVETYRWGAWATAGYAGRGATVLAVARYLNEGALVGTGPGEAIDLGGRLLLDTAGGALSLSGEGVYRFGSRFVEDRYRIAAEVAYAVAPGRTLALTLGRDFEGEPTGNVLALLRLVAGFGGEVALPTP